MQDRNINQIADDLFHIAADITDFGEFCGFDLDERRAGEFCQTTADLCFTDASWSDHQDVLGVDLIAQIIAQLFAAPTVAKCNGNGAFGLILADNKTI